MRQIVLDTETTGLSPKYGNCIIEIGAIELRDYTITNNIFHSYLKPRSPISKEATEVHGLSFDDLKDEPTFADIVIDFLDFIEDAELIIHNAPFDIGFLNAELAILGLQPIKNKVTDTLKIARALHPRQRNHLDALCERYQIDNSQRSTHHGALIDAELLAKVYLAMCDDL